MKIRALLFFMLVLSTCWVKGQTISEIQQRLKTLKLSIPISINQEVKNRIDLLLLNKGKTLSELEKFKQQESLLDNTFVSFGLPKELKYLSLSLSGCDPSKKTEFGASGPFAIRYNIAKKEGLHISSYIDERRDWKKASEVFAKYIVELRAQENDWYAVVASYYASPLEWQRAVALSRAVDFWTINGSLSEEFKYTVSNWLAAIYVANFHHLHFSQKLEYKVSLIDSVLIDQELSLYQLADKLDVPFSWLKEHNPIYKMDIIPKSNRNYYAVIPKSKVSDFYDLGEELYRSPVIYNKVSTPTPVPPTEIIVEKTETKETNQRVDSESKIEQPNTSEVNDIESFNRVLLALSRKDDTKVSRNDVYKVDVSYVVKKGDVLLALADYFDCSISDIKKWNGLDSDKINIGQKLVFNVRSDKSEYYKKIDKMSDLQKASLRKK